MLILILLIQLSFAQESRFTPEYNKQIIEIYVESTPEDSWNIFAFEKKFGSEAAVCYLAGIILMALIMKRLMK